MSQTATTRKAGAYLQTSKASFVQNFVLAGQSITVQVEPVSDNDLYLGIELDTQYQEVHRNGKRVSLAGTIAPWRLMCEVHAARKVGCTIDDLSDSIWRPGFDHEGKSTSLNKAKEYLNEKLEVLKVEVDPNRRGVWILRELGKSSGRVIK